ncbi:unnamed protein product [Tenebrio molitor]|nr:unnamed protein product [Tenebrio molitor]
MTPLDCALQRGFRSTAKYLQLHGGVPANRLGDIRHGQAMNPGLNLQIKNDVTFWGDTSSDSERENGEVTRHSKRIQRKKLSHKYEKKRASLSGSDENSKLISGHLDGRHKRRFGEKNRRVKTGGRSDSSTSVEMSKHGSRKAPSGRFDYTNEIVINGKTEINIHQSKEIKTGEDQEVQNKIPSKLSTEVAEKVISEAEKVTAEVTVEKEKRPKSAKHAKVREKSSKSTGKEDSARRKSRPNSKHTQGNSEQSKQIQTTERKVAKSVEENKDKNENENDNRLVPGEVVKEATSHQIDAIKETKLADQQSLMSNTSEDVEEHKNLVVEAAVHEPPKSTVTEDQDLEVAKEQDLEGKHEVGQEVDVAKETNEAIDKKIEQDSGEKHNVEDEVEDSKGEGEGEGISESVAVAGEKIESEAIAETNDKSVEAEKTNGGSDVKESDVMKQPIKEREETEKKIEEVSDTLEEKKNENVTLEAGKSEVDAKLIETENNKVIDENLQETTVDNGKESSEKAEESEDKTNLDVSIADAPEIKDMENEKEESEEQATAVSETVENNISKETVVVVEGAENKEELAGVENKLEKSEELGDELKNGREDGKLESEVKTETNDVVAAQSTENDISVNDANGKIEDELETVKNEGVATEEVQKPKSKKKSHRKKKQTSEDQAYEIIYKTIGDDEENEGVGSERSSVKDDATKQQTKREKLKAQKTISETKSSDEYSSDLESDSSTSTSITVKEHKSFRILNDEEAEKIESSKQKPKRVARKPKSPLKKQRSRSEENKKDKNKVKEMEKTTKSKIPTSLTKTPLSKSDKYLNIPDRKTKSSMESRVPSLPNINENRDKFKEHPRSDSNMSAPLMASVYSDNEKASASDLEEEEQQRGSAVRRKKVKRKSKAREARSAGSDYESSNVIDSGFEPSPRSSRIPKWKNMTERGVNMTSVTQSIQTNIRRYHLERKIFQHLLDLKRMQIRAGQHNEAILVKRAIDSYHQSCASTIGAGRYVPEDYSFRSFEKFLYLSLRKLQRNGADHLKGLPETAANPLLCTQSTHRCMHATHAYTGIPCAAYLPKMDHHTIPKIGFTSTQCKPGTGFLPTINPKKGVTLELCHGNDKQVISLPADRLDQNKRYYVTFTVKGSENTPPNEDTGHRHSKSD